MADRAPLSSLSDSELKQRLMALGPGLYPATPDLSTQVRRRLESEAVQKSLVSPSPAPEDPLIPILAPPPHPQRPAQRAPRRGYPVPRSGEKGVRPRTRETLLPQRTGGGGGVRVLGVRTAWLVTALLLIAIVGGLVLFPEARNAIAERLGLSGVLIRWVDEVATPEPSQVGAPLRLGRPVTLDEARAAVDFAVRVPTADGFNTPGEIYLLGQDEGAMISFVYPARPGLPASDETGVGALLSQFRGKADRGLIEKGLPADGAQQTQLQAVAVDGEPGFWISGAPHGFFFVCYEVGECREERYRLAGNVLLWEQDGVTLRLEATLSLDAALAIAESVPAPE